MPAFTATAPGKIILFGEHAVVYGRPAIAVPVTQVQARAVVKADPKGEPGELHIQAGEIGLDASLHSLDEKHPLRRTVQETLAALSVSVPPACSLRISSTIPIASGLGSGAAVSVAVVRAFSAFIGHPLPDARVSAIAFEIEKLYHGTPSGIDNAVITYARPVFFIRGQPIERIKIGAPFTIVIGDTGFASPTAAAVGDLRQAWQAAPRHYERLFDAVGQLTLAARRAIEAGRTRELGPLMDENQRLLAEMDVSSPQLEDLTNAARAAGALGAKLSGGGRGGNMIALVPDAGAAERVSHALQDAGAVHTIVTTVKM
jgi:mevalonate kinase